MREDRENPERVNFQNALVAHLRGQPDVQAALAALPDAGTRQRYLSAVFQRLTQSPEPVVAAALQLALTAIDGGTVVNALAPRAGIVISRHHNETRKPETIERNGAAVQIPAAVGNLLRDAMENAEIDADRRVVALMLRQLPELSDLLELDSQRKGTAKLRSVYLINPAFRRAVTFSTKEDTP